MRYLRHLAILALLSTAAFSQSTVVTATVTDPNGNPYANASVTANFQNLSNLIANWNGFPMQATTWSTGANSVGFFSMTLPDLNFIAPATGTFYTFTICLTLPPTLGQPSTPCFTYTSPACPITGCITGTSIDITTAIEAVPPPVINTVGGGAISPGLLGQMAYYPHNGAVLGPSTCITNNLGSFGCGNSGLPFSLTGVTATTSAPTGPNQFKLWVDPTLGLQCDYTGGTTCLNNSSAGAVLLTPTGAQNIVQPFVGASSSPLTVNNFNNVRYAQQFNWTQSPSGSISAGSNTVTLTPCPIGLDTSGSSTAPYYVYIAATGAPEAVPVTGGTCTTGATTGTVIVTALNSHASGYSVGSASGGLQEAINDAGTPNARVVIAPAGANANALKIYAPVYMAKNKLTIDGYGAMVSCFTRSVCITIGDNVALSSDFDTDKILGLRIDAGTTAGGVQVTNIALTSNVLTVTTATNHNFSTTANAGAADRIWAEFYTSGLSYHGLLTVASTPTGTTYTAPFTHTNVSSTAAFGWTGLEDAGIEDNAQDSTVEDVTSSGASGGNFNFFIVDDNDQKTSLNKIQNGGGVTNCSVNFCGAYILGRSDNSNANVIYINQSNIDLQCATNGVFDPSGNSLHISDSVIQGFEQYGIRYEAGLQNEFATNVYEEVGSCTNPFYPGSLQAQAGVIHQGQNLYWRGGAQAASPQGTFPTFANTGSIQYNYYLIWKDSVAGYGPLLYCGLAKTNGSGNISVYCPQQTGEGEATLTADLLRVTGAPGSISTPYTGLTANIAVLTNNSPSCSDGICAFTDTQAALSSYTVPAQQMWGGFWFWPGNAVIVQEATSGANWGLNAFFDSQPFGIVSAAGVKTPSVFTFDLRGDAATYSPVWVAQLGSDDGGLINGIATVIPQKDSSSNGPATNAKGAVNFGTLGNATLPVDIITTLDSNLNKTLGTRGNRPVADANDCALGSDQAGGTYNRCQTSISRYIGELADNSTWAERLTSALDKWQVPLQVTTTTYSGLPTCNSAAEGTFRPITDSTVSAVGATIAGGGSIHVKAYCNGTNWVVGEGGTAVAGPASSTSHDVASWNGTGGNTLQDEAAPTISGNQISQTLCALGPQSPVTGTGADATLISCTIPAALFVVGHTFTAMIVWKQTTGSGSVGYSYKLGGTKVGGNWTSASTNNITQRFTCTVTGSNAETCFTDGAQAASAFISSSSALNTSVTETTGSASSISLIFNTANTSAVTPEFTFVAAQ